MSLSKQKIYSAIIQKDGKWWIGWVKEVPGVTCQEATKKELLKTLQITLKEILDIYEKEAFAIVGKEYQEVNIAI